VPHIELVGPLRCETLYRSFREEQGRDGPFVFRIQHAFLRQDGRELLVESLVAEPYLKQEFLAQVRQREEGILLRLYPHCRVERSEGVKRFLVWLASRLSDGWKGIVVGHTNLGSLLPEGVAQRAEGGGGDR
jgi:hypothetical protein